MVSVEYSEAVVEVLEILQYLDDNERNKIPGKILEFFETNKSTTYYPDIDYTEKVENLKLKDKTREILAGLYVDYLCPNEEKEEYIEKLKQNEIRYQEELKQKYNTEDIFKNRKINKQIECNNNNNSLIVIEKENFFGKIIKKLKRIFKIK